jgi:hypothetical protein
MRILAALFACALAASAIAQQPPKSDEKPRPALNLRLDDGSSAAPRVTFGPSSSTQTKEDREKGLPELGGKPTKDFERPVSSGSSAVIPKAFDPQAPR